MMFRTVLMCAVGGLALLASTTAVAQVLCAASKATSAAEAPELALEEKELTFQNALDALEWLENEAPKVMQSHKTTDDLLSNTEAFGIPFPNTVMIAKGTLLRQRAMLERERLEVLTLRHKSGQGTAAEVDKQRTRFASARRAFCKFLENAQYVD